MHVETTPILTDSHSTGRSQSNELLPFSSHLHLDSILQLDDPYVSMLPDAVDSFGDKVPSFIPYPDADMFLRAASPAESSPEIPKARNIGRTPVSTPSLAKKKANRLLANRKSAARTRQRKAVEHAELLDRVADLQEQLHTAQKTVDHSGNASMLASLRKQLQQQRDVTVQLQAKLTAAAVDTTIDRLKERLVEKNNTIRNLRVQGELQIQEIRRLRGTPQQSDAETLSE